MSCTNGVRVVIAAATLVGMASVGVLMRAQSMDQVDIEPWGQLPADVERVDGSWGDVPGIAIGANGRIIAFRRGEPPIIEFDSSGKVVKTWGEGLFASPHGLHVDQEGFIWVTDAPYREEDLEAHPGKGHQVFKFSPEGELLMTLGTAGVVGAGPDTFNQPSDVVVAPNGDIFVADGHTRTSTRRIVKFSKDGTFIKAWGRLGSGPGEFVTPHAIAMDSQGRVFVADRSNQRIQIFDQDGALLGQWMQFGGVSGLYITPDDTLYAANASDSSPIWGLVIGSASDGTVKMLIGAIFPECVVLDADGTIYFGEAGRHRSEQPLKRVRIRPGS